MPRNLNRRVEVAFPIESPDLKNKIIKILDNTLKDNVKARIMQSDGTYKLINEKGEKPWSSQNEFYKQNVKEYKEFKENKF